MKKTLLIFLLLNSVASNVYASVYAQLINKKNQFVDNAHLNKPITIEIQPVKGAISGIDWDENQSIITIKEDGVYTIISNLQYGMQKSAKQAQNEAYFYYWLNVNGNPLREISYSLPLNQLNNFNSMAYYSILPLRAGTQLRFMFSTSSPSLGFISFPGIVTTTSGKLIPPAPGFTVSIFKVGNIVDYL